jgi:hypothetical protein
MEGNEFSLTPDRLKPVFPLSEGEGCDRRQIVLLTSPNPPAFLPTAGGIYDLQKGNILYAIL